MPPLAPLVVSMGRGIGVRRCNSFEPIVRALTPRRRRLRASPMRYSGRGLKTEPSGQDTKRRPAFASRARLYSVAPNVTDAPHFRTKAPGTLWEVPVMVATTDNRK